MQTTNKAYSASRVLSDAAGLLPDECGENMPTYGEVYSVCVRAAMGIGVADLAAAHRYADEAGRALVEFLTRGGWVAPRWDDEDVPTWRLVGRWVSGRGVAEVVDAMRGVQDEAAQVVMPADEAERSFDALVRELAFGAPDARREVVTVAEMVERFPWRSRPWVARRLAAIANGEVVIDPRLVVERTDVPGRYAVRAA